MKSPLTVCLAVVILFVLFAVVPCFPQDDVDHYPLRTQHPTYYRSLYGDLVATRLLQDCNYRIGIVRGFSDDKVRIDFTNSELQAEQQSTEIVVAYTRPKRWILDANLPWSNVNVVVGDSLGLFMCGERFRDKVGLAVSDESLFEGIERCVKHFREVELDPEQVFTIPKTLGEENDPLFDVYYVSLLSRRGYLLDRRRGLEAMVELIRKELSPEYGGGFLVIHTANLVSDERIPYQVRRSAVRAIIESATGDKTTSKQAFDIVKRIARMGSFDLEPVLDGIERERLVQMSESLIRSPEERKEFKDRILKKEL